MIVFKRSGLLVFISVFASFFFWGCQTGGDALEDAAKAAEDSTGAEAVEEPESVELETPEQTESTTEAAVEEEEASSVAKKRVDRSLELQAKRLGFEIRFPEEAGDVWELVGGDRTLALKEDSRIAFFNGLKLHLDEPFQKAKGKWVLGDTDRISLLDTIFGVAEGVQREIVTVVIDPGHGGSESGTKNESLGLLEKELNLDVSLRLQGHLEKLGIKALLTRYDDRLVPLAERPNIANGLSADLFVSVHFNAALNKDANGIETYALTPAGKPSSSSAEAGDDAVAYPANAYDRMNLELALRVQRSLQQQLNREDRGVKKARFAVLKTIDCPAVLVECGFLSNEKEGLLASTAGYRERVALALVDAIVGYAQNKPLVTEADDS